MNEVPSLYCSVKVSVYSLTILASENKSKGNAKEGGGELLL